MKDDLTVTEGKDPYCVAISATATREDGRLYQRTTLEQFFDTHEEQKAFQQNELLKVVATVGGILKEYGDRHEAESKQRKGR